jgi:hypothetical protein
VPIVDLYSNRNAKHPDVWIYDQIPDVLRVQVLNLIRDALGTTNSYSDYDASPLYELIATSLAHEHGRVALANSHAGYPENVHACVLKESDISVWLDCVELAFRVIKNTRANWSKHDRRMADIKITADEAIEELNERFKRAGFGYRFENGMILRIDNELMHQETTVAALQLLSDPRFSGANEEFLAAHAHFRAGENKDCAVDALNALESTMKTICEIKHWDYPKGARATDLQKILLREGLFPEFANGSFEQLVATLKSGLPVVRNDAGAHGQGATPVDVPDYVASYALNLAGAKIRLLVEALRGSENISGSQK